MNEPVDCTCPKGRPLSHGHLTDCPVQQLLEEPSNVIALVVNPETGRTVAVPGEVVEEAEREYRAFLSYKDGATWEKVASQEHYPDGRAAQAAVKNYLDEGKAIVGEMSRTEAQAIEYAYLRGLRHQLRDLIEEGKVPAIMAGLAVHDRIVKILGLDLPSAEEDLSDRTVVVPDTTYLEGLKQASGQS